MKLSLLAVAALTLALVGCSTPTNETSHPYATRYHKPLTSQGAKFGALPTVVQRTVLAEAGPEEIVDAVRDTSSGRVVYKIYFKDAEIFPPLFVAPDGSVLNPDLTVAVSAHQGTRLRLSEVPVKVIKAIPERAPSAEVAHISTESWGGRTVYVVTFKDEAHNPKLLLAEDGTVVDETQ